MSEKLPAELTALVMAIAPTGSRVICNPPPTDTDDDRIVLVSNLAEFRAAAVTAGWEPAISEVYVRGFDSYRSGDVNLIVTQDADFYNRFDAATQVARRLNVRNKDDRIALFHAVLYAEKCDAAPAHATP